MLQFVWGNSSTMMLSGDENMQETDQNRHMFDPYGAAAVEAAAATNYDSHFTTQQSHHSHHLFQNLQHAQDEQNPLHNNTLYDPNTYHHHGNSSYAALSLEPAGSYMMVPKTEPSVVGMGGVDFISASNTLNGGVNGENGGGNKWLNLGGRNYLSSSEDDFVNRLYRRSRAVETGLVNSPRCQAEGCNADLSHAKHYHRRHKVCEFHSKSATVIAAGLTQRFCQQCSRFHLLSEFDNGKRSCRKRLADHNRRRRKSQQANQENSNKSSENVTRKSPSDSGAHVSSVTIAQSPPRISLDCFRQRSSYQSTTPSSSASASSMFYSNE